MQSRLTKNQKKSLVKLYTENGKKCKLKVELRYDDECGNGHNTFAITADIYESNKRVAGGCLHDEIAKHMPELATYIKYHLMSSDGPMHYLANTIYHASNRDYNGKLKGEPYAFKTKIYFNNVPIPYKTIKKDFLTFLTDNTNYADLQIIEIPHPKDTKTYSANYSFYGFANDWYNAPFNAKEEAENFSLALKTCKVEFKQICVSWGKGKQRELDAARASAIWPEATDDQLCDDNLKELLITRLPKLIKEFKIAMEELGFIF